MSDYNFLLAYSAIGLDGLSGVCGFSRNIATTLDSGAAYIPGPIMYHQLKTAGVTDNAEFSLYIGTSSESSILEIGSSDFDTYSSNPSN